jgi:hypothetical protein
MLLYYVDPHMDGRLIALDWQGSFRGAVALPGRIETLTTVLPSPSGSRLLVDGTVYGSAGAVLGHVDAAGPEASVLWGDDERHLCRVSAAAGSVAATLTEVAIDGAVRRVATLPGGAPGVSMAACSVREDTAVAVTGGAREPTTVAVIRLSSGATLFQHAFDPGQTGSVVRSVVASPDGRLLAENSDGTTAIRSSTDGALLATLGGTVAAFSGDGTRVGLLHRTAGRPMVEVEDWRTRRVSWSSASYAGFMASRPRSPELVVGVSGPAALGEAAVDPAAAVASGAVRNTVNASALVLLG